MRSTARVGLVLFVLVVSSSAARADDVVLHWDEIAVKTLTSQTPALTPFHQARYAAMIQLAVFEAVNEITREYEPYLGSPVASAPVIPLVVPPHASAEAAAVAAAHRMLVNLLAKYFPGSTAALDAQRAASLAAIPDVPSGSKSAGIEVGEAAAKNVWDERELVTDGS